MPLPTFIIIGAYKAGTTSMHFYLDAHPDVKMAPKKDLNFFFEGLNWSKGVEWYARHFADGYRAVGEASVLYARHPRGGGAPAKMHSVVPNAKLIYMVRDPIDRILSQYVEVVGEFRERRSFDEVFAAMALPGETRGYIQCSQYYMQIEQYLKYYDKSQILVVDMERMKRERQAVLRRVFEFLDVDPMVEVADDRAHNAGELKRRPNAFFDRAIPGWLRREMYAPRRLPWKAVAPMRAIVQMTGKPIERPRLTPEQEQFLIEELRDDVEQLRAFTGQEFPHWRRYAWHSVVS